MWIYVVLLLNVLTCQWLVCNLLHMTASSPSTSLPSDRESADRPAGTVLHGVPVVAGIQYGPVIRPGRLPVLDEVESAPDVDEAERPAEAARFTAAAGAVATRLRDRAAHATGAASEVLAATATLAQDRAWLGAAEKHINSGVPAVRAVVAAVDQFVDLFTQLGGLMAERVTDLRDIRDRVIAELSGLPEPGVPLPAVPSVLLAEDLAPADTAGLDPTLVVALATTLGGPTSHTAIIARQLGIPCVVAVDGLDAVGADTKVLVDGTRGTVTVSPDPAVAADAVAAARREAELRRAVGRAGRDRRRARRVDPRQRAGRRRRPHRPRNSRRGRRPVPHRTVLPQPRHRTQRRRAGPDLRRRAGGLLRTQGRDQDAGRRLGQAPEVRRAPRRGESGARRTRSSGSPRETPGCWSGNWTPSPPRPSAPATRRG